MGHLRRCHHYESPLLIKLPPRPPPRASQQCPLLETVFLSQSFFNRSEGGETREDIDGKTITLSAMSPL